MADSTSAQEQSRHLLRWDELKDHDEELPLRELSSDGSATSGIAPDDEAELGSIEDSYARHDTASDDLAPMDHGFGAWGFLLGNWLVEAMLWGFPLSFGVFQPYYSTHPSFSSHAALIPTIGSSAVGLAYFLCIFMTPIAVRYMHHSRRLVFIGWSLCLIGLLIASIATSAWHLLLGQGLLYGLGWVICYTPLMLLLNEWFDRRRGLAYGILFGASGVSGLIIPFYLQIMLTRYGFRLTLQVYVLASVVISTPGAWLIKPRIPRSQALPSKQTRLSTSLEKDANPQYFKHATTWVFMLATLLQGLAFFLPNLFLPSFTESLSLSPSSGSTLLAVNALAQVAGQIILGHLSDEVSIYLPSSLSALISGLAVLLLWGSAKGMLQLSAFSVLWGFFAGAYSVLWTRISSEITGGDARGTVMLYAWFSVERGIASGLAGPIGAALLHVKQQPEQPTEYGLGRYRYLIIFTGLSLLLSAVCGVAYFFDRRWGIGWRRRH